MGRGCRVPVFGLRPVGCLFQSVGYSRGAPGLVPCRLRDVVPAASEAHVLVFHHEDDDGSPPIGCLDRRPLTALRDVLLTRTTTPSLCWFALWERRPGLPDSGPRCRSCTCPNAPTCCFAPVAKVVDLAAGIACLAYSGEAQGTWLEAVNEAGHRVPVDPGDLARFAEASRAAGRVRSPNLVADDRAWVVGTAIGRDDTRRRLARRYRRGPSPPRSRCDTKNR
jgi:hypothetical protein